ncbi:hypothetical protein WJX81_005602 [Elliptochloris bilobata]|uniref:AB hydrolase-1 domain-containing protein n=1 Tax=Elliptochloris bilobata TaxID=381761 RepID=A0AAW1SDU7_9CHLO
MSVATALSTAGVQGAEDLQLERDTKGRERLAYKRDGWKFTKFEGHRVHYLQAGSKGPPVVLVHGFGASGYHWRYTLPAIAASCRVFAPCLLGFGWSDKPLVEYNGYDIWPRQLASFIKEVVGEPAVLVGNSLGGYGAMATAARYPDLVRGVVLVNAAGKFEDVKAAVVAPLEAALEGPQRDAARAPLREAAGLPSGTSDSDGAAAAAGRGAAAALRAGNSRREVVVAAAEQSLLARMLAPIKVLLGRGAVYGSFLVAKQPARIRQVLNQVYLNKDTLDDDLVDSIAQPANAASAAEVFYRVITGSGTSINQLLASLNGLPVLLLWGESDPWIRPASADRIIGLYPAARKVMIPAGHCPQDDAPELFNEKLMQWLSSLPK